MGHFSVKQILILSCIFIFPTGFIVKNNTSVKICSWNIRDFGQSKDDAEILFIAKTISLFDIVLIQEVVAGPGGAQAIARLNDQLNRLGEKWDYTVSDPTYGDSYKTERYAFLWKTSSVAKTGKAWLEQNFKLEIDREPYYATFQYSGKSFTLANFHAITKNKQPETEVKYFKLLPEQYPSLNLLFCGDFNLPQSHSVFIPLKRSGYLPALNGQKTSLKKACKETDCLANEFDNVFYNSERIIALSAGIIPFYKSFETLQNALMISDHVPIYFEFQVK